MSIPSPSSADKGESRRRARGSLSTLFVAHASPLEPSGRLRVLTIELKRNFERVGDDSIVYVVADDGKGIQWGATDRIS